jgi:hypothetical protein
MAGLYEELEKADYNEHQASVFLVHTLFPASGKRGLFLEFGEARTNDAGALLTSPPTEHR